MKAFDTETCAWLDRPGWKAPPLVCVSVSDGDTTRVLHRTDDWQSTVRSALAQGIVGHHVAFDMCVIAAAGFPLEEIFRAYAEDKITCTMAREKLLDIYTGAMATQRKPRGPGYALDVLVKRRLGHSLDKSTVRLRYEELHDVPVAQWPDAFRIYAADDALYTHRLAMAQETAEGHENLVDQYRQARGAFWIQLMSTWGTTVDLPRLRGLAAKYGAEFEQAGNDLVAVGLARVEKKGDVTKLTRNLKIAGERIKDAYARQGKEHPKTDTGAPDLTREACENSLDPSLKRYSEYMQLSSKVNKEIPALTPENGGDLLHPYYDALVETGRTSCAYPNLQNLPRKGGFRECLIPRPGHVFVCADFSGFELATLAQVCLDIVGHSKLADALNTGVDPHSLIASDLSGIDYDWIRGVYKAGKDHPKFEYVFDLRQTGKVANFGFPGGLGYTRLIHFAKQSYNVNLTETQARQLKATWSARWSEMPEFFAKIDYAVGEHGAIEQLYSGRRRGDVSFCDACNGMFQGLAADIAKATGFELAKACYIGRLAGDRITNFVHDEWVCEVPENLAADHAKIIRDILVNAARPWLPGVKLDVEVSACRRYKGDCIYV